MMLRKRAITTALAAALVLAIIGFSSAAVVYGTVKESTVTSVSTVPRSVTSTLFSTITQTSLSTLSSVATSTYTEPPVTATSTVTGPTFTSTVLNTKTVTGPTTTVSSVSTQTTTVTTASTVTSTVTQGQTSASSTMSTTSLSTCLSSSATSTASASDSDYGVYFLFLASTFPGMSVSFGDNTTSGPEIINATYIVDYAPAATGSTFKVSITDLFHGNNLLSTAWILDNGTTLAFDSGGQNVTGTTAGDDLVVYTSPFIIVSEYDFAPFAATPIGDIHSTGQSTVNLGGFTMSVTNFAANSLPLVYGDCFGNTFTLNTFVEQIGTVPGTGFTLVTYLDLQGTDLNGGVSSSYSVYIHVFSASAPE